LFVPDSHDSVVKLNPTPPLGYLTGNFFPHLPRPEFRVEESFDKADFGVLLSGVG
jgi:hypothetical protein